MEIYDFFTASGINNTFSGYGPHPFFCDYCPQLSDLPDGKVYSSATCFEDNEPFRTIKIWPGWQGGSGKVKICPRNGLKVWIQIPPGAPKWVKDPVYELNNNELNKGQWGGTTQGPFLRAYSLQLPHTGAQEDQFVAEKRKSGATRLVHCLHPHPDSPCLCHLPQVGWFCAWLFVWKLWPHIREAVKNYLADFVLKRKSPRILKNGSKIAVFSGFFP